MLKTSFTLSVSNQIDGMLAATEQTVGVVLQPAGNQVINDSCQLRALIFLHKVTTGHALVCEPASAGDMVPPSLITAPGDGITG